jgi:carbon-monoxide dehydrogenase large subunit
MVYDDQGQLLTGTFMDYLVPTAMELPPIETVHLEFPSPRNPLGIKGIGEGGAISPPAAIANAIDDALADLGVRLTATPALPWRVHALIAGATAAPPSPRTRP